MRRRSSLGIGTFQTPEEAAQDPFSPTFGKFQYDVNAVEPGLDLSSPKGRFRNDLNFKRARIELIKAFEASKKAAGRLDLSGRGYDPNWASIAMMGPAFVRFLNVVKMLEVSVRNSIDLERSFSGEPEMSENDWNALKNTFAQPELEAMIDFLHTRTGDDLTTVKQMLAGLYEIAGTPGAEAAGREFGQIAAAHSRMNQEADEEARVLNQREREQQRREASAFWRRWRQAKREAEQAKALAEQGGGDAEADLEELGRMGASDIPAPPPTRRAIPSSAQSDLDELGGMGAEEYGSQPQGAGQRKIGSFRLLHYFLSNMSPSPITIDGITYPSVENAFHAMKTVDPAERLKLSKMSSFDARQSGRRVALEGGVEGWNARRVPTMLQLLRIKFTDPELRKKLLATGDAYLEEGLPAKDTFWGVVDGRGENMLGKLLMQVRDEVRTRSNGRRRF